MAKKKAGDTEILKDLVIDAILDKKGQDVVSLDLRDIHDTVADYFIITHGDSGTQVNAIFQSVLEKAKESGQLPFHAEGQKNGEWVIVDFVDVVAHIFYRERRDFYQLEELWSDAKVSKHDDATAIKTKAVRPSNKKTRTDDNEMTIEEVERSLSPQERKDLRESLNKPSIRRSLAEDVIPKEKPVRWTADKPYKDKKAPARKTASKKPASNAAGKKSAAKGTKATKPATKNTSKKK